MESELAELSAHLEAATHRQLSLIRELEPAGIWALHGARSFAGWLSWRIGLAPGAAREKIRVARALGKLAAIDEAFRVARLSYSKVRALTRVADASNEAALLGMALHATAAHLEIICRGIRRVVRDERGEVIDSHEPPERWVRERVTDDGMVRIEAQLHPDEAALVWGAIELARGLGGEGVPIDRADALVRIADAFVAGERDGAPEQHRCGAERAQVVVHLQPDAFGGAPGALAATLDDGARVPAETFRRVSCDATLLGIRTDDSGTVVEIGARTRVVSGARRRALQLRDRSCRFPSCTNHAWLDAHHLEHWAHGGATTMSNLVLLCPAHHRLVHEGGFSIVRSDAAGFEVRRPDGVLVPCVPTAMSSASVDTLRLITGARLVSAGTSIGDETLLPHWDGRAPDVSACVAAGLPRGEVVLV
ncbi:MAG: HNH endonuclease [Myxococcota bacterium]|nr:HNH endonuclease [Myxococcota bacterium]